MLLSRVRTALGVILSLSVLSVLSLAPLPTSAAPLPIRSQNQAPSPGYKHRATVSSAHYAGLKLAKKLKDQTKGRTLDYRRAKRVFGKHYIYRREFAAGWREGGGTISHVSKAESRKIDVYRKHVTRAAIINILHAKDSNCTGVTRYVGHPVTWDYMNEYWYSSCDTNKITRNLGWCMGGAGLLALLVGNPGVGAMMGILIAGCGGLSGWVSTAQSNSNKNAVIIYTGNVTKYNPEVPGPNTVVRYQVPVKVEPQ